MFQIGDRVRLLVNHPDGNDTLVIGCEGEVCDTRFERIGVKWDDGDSEKHPFHACNGYCEYGYGWYVEQYEIEHAETYDEHEFDVDTNELFSLIKE